MQLGKYGEFASEDAFLQTRRERIRDDIAKRLRRVCSHLSENEFRELVQTMADRKLNAERRKAL